MLNKLICWLRGRHSWEFHAEKDCWEHTCIPGCLTGDCWYCKCCGKISWDEPTK